MRDQDVHDGPGSVTPTTVVTDPSVPGGIRADVDFNSSTIAALRTAADTLLSVGAQGNAVLTLSPTAGSVPAPCTVGSRHACLQLNRPAADGAAAVSLFNPGAFIQFDPGRVDPGTLGLLVPQFAWAFLANEVIAINLTAFGADGQLVPEAADPFFMLGRLLPGQNRELFVRVHAEDMKIESRGGSAGLWLPITISPTGNTVATNRCDSFVSDFGAQCAPMINQMNEQIPAITCDGFVIVTRIHRARFALGLIPEMRGPGCSPASYPSDQDWMQYVPGGARYRQGCLRVRAAIEGATRVTAAGSGGDVQIEDADAVGCGVVRALVCAALGATSLLDCDAIARERSASSAAPRVNAGIRDAVGDRIAPLFTYNGAAGPFQAPAAATGCNINDPECFGFIRDHGLPASLTTVTYGWFAKAFHGQGPATTYDYPVTGIGTDPCPSFTTAVLGSDMEDVCAGCAMPQHCLWDPTAGCYSPDPSQGHDCSTVLIPTGRTLRFSYAVDLDGDGVPEALDNCPDVKNPSQADGDADGIGDACDFCPCDPSVDADPDGDGVCNVGCGGTGDNCPGVPNPGQENCNLDAEIAQDAARLGDACDPVPCPRFRPLYDDFVIKGTIFDGKAATESVLRQLRFTPIGSHNRNATTKQEFAAKVPETHYRYCIHSQIANADCYAKEAANEGIYLNIAPDRDSENESSLWYRVELQENPPGVHDGERTYLSGAQQRFTKHWLWAKDFDHWHGTDWGKPWVPPGTPGPVALPFSLLGRFWAHADTPVGTLDTMTLNTGAHEASAPGAPQPVGLANHFEPVNPFVRQVDLIGPIGVPFFPIIVRDCPHCERALGLPEKQCSICSLEGIPTQPSEVSRVLVVQPTGQRGVLTAAGTVTDLRVPLSANLDASFSQTLLWLNQAEPTTTLGWGGRAPLAVGLTPDAVSIVDEAYWAGGRMLSRRELSRSDADVPVLTSSALAHTRHDFVAVYSGSTRRVFLLGGRDQHGQPISEAWMRSLGEPDWQAVMPSEPLGKVLTATYSHTDRLVWLVDELPAHPPPMVTRRLVSFAPDGGHVRIAFSRLSHSKLFTPTLVTDQDGSLVLALNGVLLPKHLLARFRPGEPLGVEVSTPRAGRLTMPPVVDTAGYWLVSAPPGKSQLPQVERLDALPLHAVLPPSALADGI